MDISEQQLAMLTSRISMLESLASRIPQMEAVIDEMDDDGAEQHIVGDWGGGGAGGTWSGRLMAQDGTLIAEYDISSQTKINELAAGDKIYLHYDGKTQKHELSSDDANEGKHVWQVFEAPVAPATDYSLSNKTCGDAVVPVPKVWDERQILQSDIESEDGKLIFDDLKITADKSGEETGFVFEKPEDENDGLSQMKPLGIGTLPENGVLALCADTATSAAWKEIKDWPKDSKRVFITGVTGEFEVHGSCLQLNLRLQGVEVDFNNKSFNDVDDIVVDPITICGTSC